MPGRSKSYRQMFVAYLRTFARMGLKAIPMQADTGPIGGDLSHEFIILAETGESQVYLHRDLLEFDALAQPLDYDGDLSPVVDFWTSRYAATDEKHDEAAWAQVPGRPRRSRARHRGRPHLLLRHQIHGRDGPAGRRARTARR